MIFSCLYSMIDLDMTFFFELKRHFQCGSWFFALGCHLVSFCIIWIVLFGSQNLILLSRLVLDGVGITLTNIEGNSVCHQCVFCSISNYCSHASR